MIHVIPAPKSAHLYRSDVGLTLGRKPQECGICAEHCVNILQWHSFSWSQFAFSYLGLGCKFDFWAVAFLMPFLWSLHLHCYFIFWCFGIYLWKLLKVKIASLSLKGRAVQHRFFFDICLMKSALLVQYDLWAISICWDSSGVFFHWCGGLQAMHDNEKFDPICVIGSGGGLKQYYQSISIFLWVH